MSSGRDDQLARDPLLIKGKSLTRDLMGKRSFVETFYLRSFSTFPDGNVTRMLDLILVTLMEHGPTPSSIAARLTLLGAPESFQAAVASGLLSAGSRYLGTVETVARMLQKWMQPDGSLPGRARELVAHALAAKQMVPGFGHPIHTQQDPRVEVLQRMQTELGISNRHMTFMGHVAKALREAKGSHLPLNAAGAIGAILRDMNLPPEFGQGMALVARCAGLVGHLLEEIEEPMAPRIWDEVARLER